MPDVIYHHLSCERQYFPCTSTITRYRNQLNAEHELWLQAMTFSPDFNILCRDRHVHPSQLLQCCVWFKRCLIYSYTYFYIYYCLKIILNVIVNILLKLKALMIKFCFYTYVSIFYDFKYKICLKSYCSFAPKEYTFSLQEFCRKFDLFTGGLHV